jgi:hypothetical protein
MEEIQMQKLTRKLGKFSFVFAGGEACWQMLIKANVSIILFSYYRLMSWPDAMIKACFEQCVAAGIRIVLDSGAFSAYKMGVVLDLKKYADFIIAWSEFIWMAVNLDEIRRPDITAKNQETLLGFGAGDNVPLVTVHHQHEVKNADGTDVLLQMLSDIQPYQGRIYCGISPEDGAHSKSINSYLQSCLHAINSEKPYHIHIFGLGYTQNLKNFLNGLDPKIRLTADSRSYAEWAEKRFLVLESGHKIRVGTRSYGADHILALPKIEQVKIGILLEEAGLRWDDVIGEGSGKAGHIAYFNCLSLMKIQEKLNQIESYKGKDEMDIRPSSFVPEVFG